MVEGKGVTKGNAEQIPAPRTLSRSGCASMGLERVRKAARQNRQLRFTALLHHITPELIGNSFYSCKRPVKTRPDAYLQFASRCRDAAAGVDEVSWREYEQILAQGYRYCIGRFTPEHIGHVRRGGFTFPKRMGGNVRWALPR